MENITCATSLFVAFSHRLVVLLSWLLPFAPAPSGSKRARLAQIGDTALLPFASCYPLAVLLPIHCERITSCFPLTTRGKGKGGRLSHRCRCLYQRLSLDLRLSYITLGVH